MKTSNRKWTAIVLTLVFLLQVTTVSFAGDWLTFQLNNDNNAILSSSASPAPPIATTTTINTVSLPASSWVGIDNETLIKKEGNNVFAYVHHASTTGPKISKINLSTLTPPGGSWGTTASTDGLTVGSGTDFQLSTPIISGNTMYVALTEPGTLSGYKYILKKITNIDTNTPTVTTILDQDGYGQINTPLKFDGTYLYAGTWIDSTTGDRYYYKIDPSLSGSASIVGSYAITGTTGFYWAGAAIVGNYIVVGADNGKIYAINKTTMTTVPSNIQTVGGQIRSSICHNNGSIYFTDKTGGRLIKREFDSTNGTFSGGWEKTIGTSTSTPACDGSYVYVGMENGWTSGKIICVNATDGSDVWDYPVSDGMVKASPVVYKASDGTTYVYFTSNGSSGKGYCCKHDPLNGESIVWSTSTTYNLQGMSIGQGYAVFGNDSGTLYIAH